MSLRRLWIVVLLMSLVVVNRAQAHECNEVDDGTLLKPELMSMPPADIRVLQRQGVKQILFTSSISNVGAGPFIVHGETVITADGPKTKATQEVWFPDGTYCTHDIGFFEFHPEHHHFHVGNVAAYELRKDDPITGPIVASSEKVSFCLLDVAPIKGFGGAPQFVNNCTDPQGTYGISVGYSDVYESILPGQSIDITNVPEGDYFLVNRVNPGRTILEKTDDPAANAGIVSVHIRAHAVRIQRARPPRPPRVRVPHQPHPPHTTVIFPRPRVPHTPQH